MAFSLPTLPYDFDALEPHISADIMKIHYEKHHQGYLNKLNAAIENTAFADRDIVDILSDTDAIPADIKAAVINNGGGYHNHLLFWESMTPGGSTISSDLETRLSEVFGSVDDFKEQFSTAANTLFGSGWAWLVQTPDGRLEIVKTANQNSPLSHGQTPLLGLDVWEHAYYLQYQNRKPEYVASFWNIVNWDTVEQRLID